MNRAVLIGLGVVGVVALIVAMAATFTVHQTQTALVLQLGNPVRAISEPGLHFKLPFIQNVEYYDKRILDLDPPIQQVILSDRKRIDVDSFARYRIVDPLEFKKKAVTIDNFRSVFGGRLNSAVRAQVGKVGLSDMVSAKRDDVMLEITNLLKAQEAEFGIEVVDVRIGRTDLPEDISNDVYNRMRSEREREASLLRAEGDELKQRITADADRQKTIIIAEATGRRISCVVRATPNATAFSGKLTEPTRSSSPSTARWRPTARLWATTTRRWCCRPTARSSVSSATSPAEWPRAASSYEDAPNEAER